MDTMQFKRLVIEHVSQPSLFTFFVCYIVPLAHLKCSVTVNKVREKYEKTRSYYNLNKNDM